MRPPAIRRVPTTAMRMICQVVRGGFAAAATAAAENEVVAMEEVADARAVCVGVGVPSVQFDWHPLATRQLE